MCSLTGRAFKRINLRGYATTLCAGRAKENAGAIGVWLLGVRLSQGAPSPVRDHSEAATPLKPDTVRAMDLISASRSNFAT